jgi:hypothetical protein
VRLTGTNAQTGTIEVRDGALGVGSAAALGSAASGTVVSSGATLAFASGVTVTNPEPLQIRGSGDPQWQGAMDVEGAGVAAFVGPIELLAATTMASGGEGGSLILNGPISGAGALEKAVAGR